MSEVGEEDSLTELNTQLNKSMVLMDYSICVKNKKSKGNKSITINMIEQPPSTLNVSHNTNVKSILKKTNKLNNEKNVSFGSSNMMDFSMQLNSMINETPTLDSTSLPRPQTLQDFKKQEFLVDNNSDFTFSIDDISDSEEIWIMDIPKTIDPAELKDQTLTIGEKSKIKIKDEKYYACKQSNKSKITCVLKTNKTKRKYKTVNINLAGSISLRKKLPSMPKIKPIATNNIGVPFPENLKQRHPFFGVVSEN